MENRNRKFLKTLTFATMVSSMGCNVPLSDTKIESVNLCAIVYEEVSESDTGSSGDGIGLLLDATSAGTITFTVQTATTGRIFGITEDVTIAYGVGCSTTHELADDIRNDVTVSDFSHPITSQISVNGVEANGAFMGFQVSADETTGTVWYFFDLSNPQDPSIPDDACAELVERAGDYYDDEGLGCGGAGSSGTSSGNPGDTAASLLNSTIRLIDPWTNSPVSEQRLASNRNDKELFDAGQDQGPGRTKAVRAAI